MRAEYGDLYQILKSQQTKMSLNKMNFARNVFVMLKLFTEDVLTALTPQKE
jgi:hypothetical protein